MFSGKYLIEYNCYLYIIKCIEKYYLSSLIPDSEEKAKFILKKLDIRKITDIMLCSEKNFTIPHFKTGWYRNKINYTKKEKKSLLRDFFSFLDKEIGESKYHSQIKSIALTLLTDKNMKIKHFEPEDYYNLAFYYQMKGSMDLAESNYKKILNIEPEDYSIRLCLGLFYRYSGQEDKALNEFQKVLELRQNCLPARIFTGETFLFKRKIDKAINCLKELLKDFPSSEIALFYLGKIYLHKRNPEEAKKYLEKLIKEHKKPVYYKYLSIIYKDLKEMENFKGAFTHYLKFHEKDPDCLSISGDQNYSLGNFEIALNKYKKAEELNPENADYKYRLGKILLALGNSKDCHLYFQKAVEINPLEARFHNALSYSFYKLGNLKKAFDHSYKALKLNPKSRLFIHNLATIKMEILKKADFTNEDLEKIDSEYEKAGINGIDIINISKNFSELGMLFFRKGNLKKALLWFIKAGNLNPNNPDFYIHIGTVELLEGSYDNAISNFKKALELHSTSSPAHRGLALCYEKQGYISMAILEYEHILKINPSDKHSRKSLAYIYDKLMLRNRFNSFLNLGRIYLKEGNIEKALYEFYNAINTGSEIYKIIPELNLAGKLMLAQDKEGEALRIYEKNASLLKNVYKKVRAKYVKSVEDSDLRLFEISYLWQIDKERINCYKMLIHIYYAKGLYMLSDYYHISLRQAIQDISTNLNFYGTSQKEMMVDEIERISDFFSEDHSYLMILGNCFFKIGKYKKAAITYERALLINSQEFIHNRTILNSLFKRLAKKELHAFEGTLLKLIKLSPGNSMYYFILGDIYLNQYNPQKAIKFYKHALRLNPQRKIFLCALANAIGIKGLLLYEENKFKEAEHALTTAYRIGDNKEIINRCILNLAIIYFQRNEFKKSMEFFLKLNNNLTSHSRYSGISYRYLGMIYEKLGEMEKADSYNRKFISKINLYPSPDFKPYHFTTFYKRQSLLEEETYIPPLNDIKLGIEEYERAIELEPQKIHYYNMLTKLYRNIQKLDELSSKFIRKISENILYANIFIQIGLIYTRDNFLKKSIQEFDIAIRAGLRTEELASALNELGMKYYEKGNMDRAEVEFNKAIEIYETFSDAYYNLGNIWIQKGYPTKAIHHFLKAIETEINVENKTKYLNILGRAYLQVGELISAFEQFKKAAEITPNCTEAYCNLALTDYRLGILDEATKNFLKTLELEPNHYIAIKGLRDLYRGQVNMEKHWQEELSKILKIKMADEIFLNSISTAEELEELIKEYEHAVTLSENDAKYFKKLGKLYLKEGKIDKALISIEKATELNPALAYLYIEISNVCLDRNKLEQSRYSANKAIEVGIKTLDLASVCIKIGNQLSQQGDLDGANSEYERAWNMGCRSKDLALKINKLGVDYSSVNRFDEAIENFKKTILIIPDNCIFHKNLGIIYQRKGFTMEAIKSFEKGMAIEPKDIKILEKLKEVYKEAGYFTRAIKILEKLLELKPKTLQYIFYTGQIYQELGKYKKAAEYYKETINIKKDWYSPYIELGFIYLNENNLIEARQNLEQGYKLNINNPRALIGMGRIYALQRELNLSEEYYSKAFELYEEEMQKKGVSPDIHLMLGDMHFYRMEIDMAIAEYKKALKIKEEYPSGALRLGKSLIIIGEILEGERTLKNIAKNDIEFPEVYLYLGDIYRIKGLLQEAIEQYRKVIRLNPDWVYRAYQNLGEIYAEINEKNLSRKCYNKARQLKGGNLIISSPNLSSLDVKEVIDTIEKDLREP